MSSTEREGPSPWRQVGAFAPLCAVASAYWGALLVDPPAGRIAAVVAIASTCGLVLALSKHLEPYGHVEARVVRVATVAVAVIAGPLAVGVPPAVLAPPGWEQLLAADLPSRWPYGGGDPGVRRTVLLAIPLMTVPAAAFALWPPATGPGGAEAAAARRAGALLCMLTLIGFATAERPGPDTVARGALLLLALAAWLFLPRVRAQPMAALAAGAVVVAAGLVSLPLATALEPGRPPPDRPAQEQGATPPSASSGAERGERSRSRRRSRRTQQRRGGGSGNRSANRPRPPRRPEGEEGVPAGVAILLGVVVALAVSLLVARRVRPPARHRGSVADEADELRIALERLGWSVPPQTTLIDLERRLDEGAGPAAARYARRLRERRFGALVEGRSPGLDRPGLRRALTEGLGPLGRLRGLVALPPAAVRLRR